MLKDLRHTWKNSGYAPDDNNHQSKIYLFYVSCYSVKIVVFFFCMTPCIIESIVIYTARTQNWIVLKLLCMFISNTNLVGLI